MTLQWLRKLKLEYQGVSLDENMRVRFKVESATSQSLNKAEIIISNLSPATAAKMLVKPEGKVVSLSAAYEGNIGLIFKGNVIQVRKGRESPTDTILIIDAYEGDIPYNRGVVNKALPKGSTSKEHYDTFVEAMKPYGVDAGHVPAAFANFKYPRAVAFFGMARDYLRTLAHSNGCTWSIQRGKVDMVPINETLPGSTVVLNAKTGMIGMPTQTQQAIIVTALINPAIQINGAIKLNNKDIQQGAITATLPDAQGVISKTTMPNLPADGLYKVLQAVWEGDTRAGPWYVTCTCLALNGEPGGNPSAVTDLLAAQSLAGLAPGAAANSTNPITGPDGSTTHLGND